MPRAPKPSAPRPPQDPNMSPGPHGAVPPTPGQKVSFRHPATGEQAQGHIHATGSHGATIVDGEGSVHRVPHGHYMHDDAPVGGDPSGPKPSGQQVLRAARKHLELGPDAMLAVLGAAAMLVVGGVDRAHELQSQDVAFHDGCAYVKPDKLRTDDEALVPILQKLQQASPRGPIFQIKGKPITEDQLTTYVRRFGATGGATPSGAPPAPNPAAMAKGITAGDIAAIVPQDLGGEPRKRRKQKRKRKARAACEPMNKANPIGLRLPARPKASSRWRVDQYDVEFSYAPSGLGLVSIRGPGMIMPLHEVCSGLTKARELAGDLIDDLKNGRAPRSGLFQVVA